MDFARPDRAPYTIAKMTENPTSAGKSRALRQLIEAGIRENWTLKKVAAMTTEAIEAQLLAYGVKHSRQRFLKLVEDRHSAWGISDTWLDEDAVSCRGKEEDFLGLAACELWKRLLPDRPSVEMLDDWMQEGYAFVAAKNESQACDVWWRTWCALRALFTPDMTTMHAAEETFSGMQSVFNWSQDFEMHLGNAAARGDRRYAEMGRDYCRQWISQFVDEDASMQVSFRLALAGFLCGLGDVGEAKKVLQDNVELWPDDVWGYVALADAYSHFFRRTQLTAAPDPDMATAYIRQGLARPGLSASDREILEDRLTEIRRNGASAAKRETGAPMTDLDA